MREFIEIAKVLCEDVFHGTPHAFDKFSLDHVGTGEGAASYGWGLYFAGKREVAEYYRDALATDLGQLSKMKEYLRELEEAVARGGAAADAFLPTLEQQRRYVANAEKRLRGRIVTAKIPDEGSYLLWDAGFTQQPGVVQNALMKLMQADDDRLYYQEPSGGSLHPIEPAEVEIHRKLIKRMGGVIGTKAEFLRRADASGEVFYDHLASELGHKENASKALLRAGVPGIKYLDQDSRNVGHGTYNYVIFDDSLVSITKVEPSE